ADDDFSQKFRTYAQMPESAIILVDKKHEAFLARFKKIYAGRDNITTQDQANTSAPSKVFIIADKMVEKFQISSQRQEEALPMFNVAGIIPGKSKADEFVIFSSHYD